MTSAPRLRHTSASWLMRGRISRPRGAATGEFSTKQFCMSMLRSAVRCGSNLKSVMMLLLVVKHDPGRSDAHARAARLSVQCRSQSADLVLVCGARRERAFHVHLDEPRQIVGLHLRDAVHVGADHGADHGVSAARYGV